MKEVRGFWDTQRAGMKEGRKERRVWGLAVPSNTKTLRGDLSPAPGTGTSPLLLTQPRPRPSLS